MEKTGRLMKNVERERIMRDYLFNAKDAKDLWCFAGVFGGDRKGRKGVEGNRLRLVIVKDATRISRFFSLGSLQMVSS